MKFILALSFFIFSPFLCAYEKEFVITQILSDEVIKIEKLDPNIEIESGDILLIYLANEASINENAYKQ